jgi:hypothetical protein
MAFFEHELVQRARERNVAGQRIEDRHWFYQMDLKSRLENRRRRHVAFHFLFFSFFPLQLVTLYEASWTG